MAYESEKARLERIMSEFVADDAEENEGRDGVPESLGRRIGEEELLPTGGRRLRRITDLQKGFLRKVRQQLRDEMAFRGITVLGLARKSNIDRRRLQDYFTNENPNLTIRTVKEIADAIGVEMKIIFEDRKEEENDQGKVD
jgi:lambda repressor-like predicted transcriptional regulator